MDLILFLIIGLLAGWLGGRLLNERGFGRPGNLLVGVAGAVIGGFLFDQVGLATGGVLGSLIMALVGALALLSLVSFIRRR